jgi:hypothetical protein
VEDDSHIAFGQKFPGETGSVKQRNVVMLQFSPKLGAKSSQIFMQSP